MFRELQSWKAVLCALAVVVWTNGTAAAFGLDSLSGIPADTLSVQLRWRHQFQFAGYYAAVEKGYYRKAGLKVRLLEGGPDVDTATAVLEGRAAFGVDGASLVAERLNGKPLVLLASIFQHNPYTLFIRTDAGILTPHDLMNHPVWLREDRSAPIFALLESEGVDLTRLDIVDADDPVGAFIEGRIAAFAGYLTNEPFRLRAAEVPYRAISPAAYGLDFYGDSLFTSAAFLRGNPGAVRAFREASIEGWRYAMAHVDEMIRIMRIRYCPQHSRERLLFEAREVHELIRPDFVEIGHFSRARWRRTAVLQAGPRHRTGEAVDLAGFFYDPSAPVPSRRFLRILLISTAVVLSLSALTAGVLAVFNRQLRIQVKLKAQAIGEQEKRFRDLFENSLVGIFRTLIGDGTFIEANRKTAALMGFATPEALIRNCKASELYPREVRADFMARLIGGPQPGMLETRFTFDDGSFRDIALHARAYPEKGYLDGVMIDVTERKRAEERLREAFELSRDILYKLDLERMVYEYASPALKTIFGLDAESLDGLAYAVALQRASYKECRGRGIRFQRRWQDRRLCQGGGGGLVRRPDARKLKGSSPAPMRTAPLKVGTGKPVERSPKSVLPLDDDGFQDF